MSVKSISAILVMLLTLSVASRAEVPQVWTLETESGTYLTEICYAPAEGDIYISADNISYSVVQVENRRVIVTENGRVDLPTVEWLNINDAVTVSALSRKICLYCTHSDESYTPTDGFYSTTERGTIYHVAESFAEALEAEGIQTYLADTLHHPHDAGAYRRSRQTAVNLLKHNIPDCLIDIHRDGITDPSSYAVEIGGEEVSKIRLLVGRGNQNADMNKEFALLIKAVADYVYPGLIKDIYLGKGTFNQDLLPRSLLLECGTYTLSREHVERSMPLLADVFRRALYGGITGSAGRTINYAVSPQNSGGGITMGETTPVITSVKETSESGLSFLIFLLFVVITGIAILSAGSLKRGTRKAARNLHEMTGGMIGKKPETGEEHDHS